MTSAFMLHSDRAQKHRLHKFMGRQAEKGKDNLNKKKSKRRQQN